MNKKAFTLIELLVVVLIIGILAAIALPQYQKAVAKTKLHMAQVLVESMLKGCQVYYLANNEYPETPDLLDIEFPVPTDTTYNESIKRTTLNYPWGFCEFHAGDGIGCYNTISGIAYQKSLSTGRRECKADKNNTTSQALCKAETGKSAPDYTGDAWLSYYYQ